MRTLLSRSLGLLRLTARDPRLVEIILKAAAVMVGLAYVAGLFVVNFHLSLYGLHGLGLLRVEYVLAGATWLFLTVFAYLLWRNILTPLYTKDWRLGRRLVASAWRLLLSAAMLFFVFVVITYPDANSFRFRDMSARAAAVALVALGLTYPAAVVLALVGTEDGAGRNAPTFLLPYIGVCVIATLALYSIVVYPGISPAYGGGAATPVRVFLTTSASADVRANLSKLSDSESVVYLLTETSEWFAFAPRPELTITRKLARCVRVRREDVEMIVLAESK